MFLLDTNVISELRKARNGKANPRVVKWSSAQDVSDLFISSITLMELEVGILRAHRKDARKGTMLRNWLQNQIIKNFQNRILPFGADEAVCCARLHVPNQRPERDAIICATAIVHGMTVITRNVVDFSATGVTILNPWDT